MREKPNYRFFFSSKGSFYAKMTVPSNYTYFVGNGYLFFFFFLHNCNLVNTSNNFATVQRRTNHPFVTQWINQVTPPD